MMVRRSAEAVATELLDSAGRAPAATFPTDAGRTRDPGLYAWFVDRTGAAELSAGLGQRVGSGLIYAGQAGAGSSTATLRSRVRGNHLGGTITGSTFRMTLASVLVGPLGLVDGGGRALEGDGEARLSAWMRTHLSIAVAPVADRLLVARLEPAVLARLDPPLNLQGMPSSPVREALRARRRRPLGGRHPGGSVP